MTAMVAPSHNAANTQQPFWKRVGWLTIGQAMEKAGQLAFVVLLVRILAPDRWNSVALALTAYLAAVTIGSFNLEQSVLFYLPRLDRQRQSALIARTSLLLAVVGTLIGTGIAIFGHVTGVFGAYAAPFLLGAAVAVEMPSVIAGPVLILRSRTAAAGIWDSTQAIAQCVAVIVPAALGMSNSMILGGLLLASVIRLVSYPIVVPEVLRSPMRHAERSLVVEQLVFCAPLGVALATGTLARVADKWIVAWHLPHQVGMYAIAAQEIPLLSVLPYAGGAAIAVALVDHLRNDRTVTAHDLWYRQAAAMCRTVIPLVVGLVVIAPEVFSLVFGTRYSAAIVPFQVFTVVGAHRVTEYGVVLRAAGKTGSVVMSSVVLLGANVALGVPAALVGGVIGLTVASVAAFGIAWWWILGRVAEVFGESRVSVFPWRVWTNRVAVYACVGAGVASGIGRVDGAPIRLIAKITLMALAVIVVEHFDPLPANVDRESTELVVGS